MATFGDMETGRQAVIMLGGNLGDRNMNLETAKHHIAAQAGEILEESSVYETAAYGMKSGTPDFLNQAIRIKSNKKPEELLSLLLEIEMKMGRKRTGETDSRVIDIDLILFEDQVIQTEVLTLPHPRFHLRRFNMLPINEIASSWQHPLFKTTMGQLLNNCQDTSKVVLYSGTVV